MNFINLGGGDPLCTFHRAEGLYNWAKGRGYMRDSLYKRYSGRLQQHRPDYFRYYAMCLGLLCRAATLASHYPREKCGSAHRCTSRTCLEGIIATRDGVQYLPSKILPFWPRTHLAQFPPPWWDYYLIYYLSTYCTGTVPVQLHDLIK